MWWASLIIKIVTLRGALPMEALLAFAWHYALGAWKSLLGPLVFQCLLGPLVMILNFVCCCRCGKRKSKKSSKRKADDGLLVDSTSDSDEDDEEPLDNNSRGGLRKRAAAGQAASTVADTPVPKKKRKIRRFASAKRYVTMGMSLIGLGVFLWLSQAWLRHLGFHAWGAWSDATKQLVEYRDTYAFCENTNAPDRLFKNCAAARQWAENPTTSVLAAIWERVYENTYFCIDVSCVALIASVSPNIFWTMISLIIVLGLLLAIALLGAKLFDQVVQTFEVVTKDNTKRINRSKSATDASTPVAQ